MRMFRACFVAIITLLVAGNVWAEPRMRPPLPDALRVVSADAQSVILELTVAGMATEPITYAGERYDQVIIDGMPQTTIPGAPQVPTRGALIGIPSVDNVTLRVLEADAEVHSGFRLPPAPALSVTAARIDTMRAEDVQMHAMPDPAWFATNAFFPGAPAEIGEVGYLRDQAVAQVRFYPVQYNPVTGELRHYRRVRVQVTWDAAADLAARAPEAVSPAFEGLLRGALLNYDSLDRPPTATAARATGTAHADAVPADAPPALKISVTTEGIYKLTPDALAAAGFDLAWVDPRRLKLHNRGVEVPIYVHGEGDGTFDAADYILFYGAALNDVYTNRNVYWLTAGNSSGRRMQTRAGAPTGSADVPAHFPTTLHAEQDTYYWQTMPNGAGQDHWFWGTRLSTPGSRDYTLSLTNIAQTAENATVRVQLKGFTNVNQNPDHHTRIYLNDTQIDDQRWDGQAIFTHTATVPHDLLREGENIVRVETRSVSGVSVNQILMNWIEIDYRHTYVAENDVLQFGAPQAGTFQFEVANFSRDDVAVFDVTDPASVVRIVNPAVTQAGNGQGYRLAFEDTAQAATRYLALTSPQYRSPAALELDTPSAWKRADHGADYIIITHRDFYDSALRLADHRSAMGLRTLTVDVQDLYDEFNHGIFNPHAIRDFLAYAYANWARPAPVYVVLLGDAYQDYKDNLETGTRNYVPAQIVNTRILGETPSDNWFVTISGDDVLPDMFVGRLSAETPAQAAAIVEKIIRYEQNPPEDTWNTRALFVADDDDDSFVQMSETLAGLLPDTFTARQVNVGDYASGSPTADIKRYIEEGSSIVNYAGHGQVDAWGIWQNETFFDLADVRSLDNTHKLPVVTVANCLNGFFTLEQTKVSLAEELQRRADTGAIAVWAATGLDYPSGHRLLMSNFYQVVFQEGQHDLGAATTGAKIATYTTSNQWDDLVKTFVLFGDPATAIGVPADPSYITRVTPADGATDVPVNQPLEIVFSRSMNPATVTVSGPGTVGLTPTLRWSDNYTLLTYAHTGFGYDETRTFSVQGQDRQGNALDAARAPTTWSFTTRHLSEDQRVVVVSGPERGDLNVEYTFGAILGVAGPATTYVWEATDQEVVTHANAGPRDTAAFTWTTSGLKTITVTATNTEGTFTGTHSFLVGVALSGDAGPIYLPLVTR